MALLALGCADAEKRKQVEGAPLISLTYTDDWERSFTFQNPPQKVVSIAPNITEIIFAIGAEDKLVGRSQACDYPDEVLMFPEITTFPQLDLEQLKVLDADLIFSTDEIFTKDDLAQLDRLDFPVFIQHYEDMQDIYRGIQKIGHVLQVDTAAQNLVDSLQTLEQRIIDSTENQIKYQTMILISADPLKVVGGAGFLNQLIEKAGGKNVFAENDEAYPEMTPEAILKAQPEFLILPSNDPQVYADLLAKYPILYNTSADQLKQVHIIDPDHLYRPGPRTLTGLLELTHILHTQLNPQKFTDAF